MRVRQARDETTGTPSIAVPLDTEAFAQLALLDRNARCRDARDQQEPRDAEHPVRREYEHHDHYGDKGEVDRMSYPPIRSSGGQCVIVVQANSSPIVGAEAAE